MTKWIPDTCDCEIEYDNSFNFVKVFNKCKFHKNFDGQDLLDKVMKHNRSFNHQKKSEARLYELEKYHHHPLKFLNLSLILL